MYQKPDFLKVSVKIKDIYSGYMTSGCVPNDMGGWSYTSPCEGTDDWHYVPGILFTELGGDISSCYTTNLP